MTEPAIDRQRQGRKASSAFFLRLGQAKHIDERYDQETLPLWPLLIIMAADGTLTPDATRLARKVRA